MVATSRQAFGVLTFASPEVMASPTMCSIPWTRCSKTLPLVQLGRSGPASAAPAPLSSDAPPLPGSAVALRFHLQTPSKLVFRQFGKRIAATFCIASRALLHQFSLRGSHPYFSSFFLLSFALPHLWALRRTTAHVHARVVQIAPGSNRLLRTKLRTDTTAVETTFISTDKPRLLC